MKLEKDENVYVFLEKEQINIMADNKNKKEFINCLIDFFVRKKRNICHIFNDDGEKIQNNDYEFIYIPSDLNLEQNLNLKEKTITNTEISQLIEQNPKLFTSIDKIRDDLYQLCTDSGIYKLKKIMEKGLNTHINFMTDDFNLSKLLSMMCIEEESLSDREKYLMIINLMIYIKRNQNLIIYLDIPIDEYVIQWIYQIKDENMIFILDNSSIINGISEIDGCSFIVLSNKNYCEEYEWNISDLSRLNYIFNPFVLDHMDQQTEKNIKIMTQFSDKNTTFYLNFRNQNTQISFK